MDPCLHMRSEHNPSHRHARHTVLIALIQQPKTVCNDDSPDMECEEDRLM